MLPKSNPRWLFKAHALRLPPGRPLTQYPEQSQQLPAKLHVHRRAAQPVPVAASSTAAELIPYTPVKKGEVYDLRFYGPYTVAQVLYNRRDEGFLALGEYLSGCNATGSRMQETQPIVMCYHPDVSCLYKWLSCSILKHLAEGCSDPCCRRGLLYPLGWRSV